MRRTRPLLGLLVIAALVGAGACTTTDPGTASTTSSATATAIGTEADLKALEGVTVTEAPLSASPTANPSSAATPGTVPTATTTATATTTTTPEGTAPVLTLANTPLTVSATTRRIVAAGSGPLSGPDSLVSAHLSVSLGSTGQQLDSTYRLNEPVKLAMSNPETIAGLLTGLTGVQARSRVLVAIPPDEAYGSQGNPQVGISGTETLLVLADIVAVATPLSQAEGTTVAPAAGLPTVTFDATTGPTVSIPSGASPPTDTVAQLLVEGSGPPLASGQLVSVHYTGVLWKDGSVFDSSWTKKAPFAFPLGEGQVIPAWETQLVGKKVGSRVLLVVPPKDGYGDAGSPPKIAGNDTLVFVIDILGAL